MQPEVVVSIGSNPIYPSNKLNKGRLSKMSNKQFQLLAVKTVMDYFNNRVEKTDQVQITENDVYIVWYCKTLQNHKALLSTTISDGMYYEITFNGDKSELYLDAYKKWENKCIEIEV